MTYEAIYRDRKGEPVIFATGSSYHEAKVAAQSQVSEYLRRVMTTGPCNGPYKLSVTKVEG